VKARSVPGWGVSPRGRRYAAWAAPRDLVDRRTGLRPDLVGGQDPLGLAIAAERATRVRAAVAALQEPYRETVALRFFAELSLVEIAEQTGRPLGTVKTHLHRGLARLRDAMRVEVTA
jgi:RNA polymerase sigma-70 factor (ECF subfamily)